MRAAASSIVLPPHRAFTVPRRIIAFILVVVCEFFSSWSWNTVDVLRPQIRDALDLTLTQAGSAYSAQGLGGLIGALLFGQIADRIGRRTILPFLLLGFGLLLLASLLVTSYAQLLGQRFMLGVCLGGSYPVLVGIYVDLFDQSVRGRLAAFMLAVFSLSLIAMGWTLSLIPDENWRLMFWIGGIPPIVLAMLVYPAIPRIVQHTRERIAKLPVTELFSADLRRQTGLLTLLCGLNFFAYQAFNGWMTVYLHDILKYSNAVSGAIVAWQFTGYTLGAFVWGWVADRFGRKRASLGFILAATTIYVFLRAPGDTTMLAAIGFFYGFGLSCSVIWGPWLAEMYPPHLRSTAISIFHWGRIVSFIAPLITGFLAEEIGLVWAMMTGSAVFFAATAIWYLLPETLAARKPT